LTSDKEPKNNILIASDIVARERDKLAIAGEIRNSWENSGNRGCVLYKMANVVKPPKNNAIVVLRKAIVPF
jgi:hypothetical protein